MTSALIIVDMQYDFIDGSLAVKDSELIIDSINQVSGLFSHIILTQDSHPQDHISFNNSSLLKDSNKELVLDELTNKYKGTFPVHCVKNSKGWELHEKLKIRNISLIVEKGCKLDKEEFSGFCNPILNEYLQKNNIKNVFVCGLALDFCVGFTAVDSAKCGYKTFILKDLTKSISNATENEMIDRLEENKVKLISTNNIKDCLF